MLQNDWFISLFWLLSEAINKGMDPSEMGEYILRKYYFSDECQLQIAW